MSSKELIITLLTPFIIMNNTFDFNAFKADAIEELKAGVSLSGQDGVLAPLLENLLNSAIKG